MLQSIIVGICLLVHFVAANQGAFDENLFQICTGMYSKKDWSGPTTPYIQVHLHDFSPKSDDVDLSFVVFEYRDVDLIGAEMPDGSFKYICDDVALANDLCSEKSLNKFIVNKAANSTAKSEILTAHMTSLGYTNIDYQVKNTGYYCVATFSATGDKYSGYVNFRNSFGQLSASEIPKLPAYGILAICYAVGLFIYLFNYYRHRNEILPLQKYIAFFFGFLTAETILIWSFYDLENNKGMNVGVKFYMMVISLLNAARITFSFFLLLVIALGYGVVHAKLDNKLMLKCKIFAGVTFICAVIYIVGNYLSSPQNQNYWLMLTFLPIAICLVVFYVVILASLRGTTQYLVQQRQIIKLGLYQNLFRIVFVSLLVVFGGVVVSSFIFIGMSSEDMIEQHWKSRFFVFDFWPSLVYFLVFCAISFIWRPTETSYMLAVSQQVSTNPDNVGDFDLDDLSVISRDDNQMRRSDSIDFELNEDEREQQGSSDYHEAASTSKSNPPAYDDLDDSSIKPMFKKSAEEDGDVFKLDEDDFNEDDRLHRE